MINRLIKKIVFHLGVFLLKPLEGRFSRTYMRLYIFLLKMMGLKMDGNPRFISSQVKFDDFSKIQLSERVVISDKVILLTHDYSITTGIIAIGNIPQTDIAFIREIKIGKNVFIGMGSIIMPGTIIHDNVVIGAGSVVRGIIPTDSIVIGNPCKIIGKLTEKAEKWILQIDDSTMQKDRK